MNNAKTFTIRDLFDSFHDEAFLVKPGQLDGVNQYRGAEWGGPRQAMRFTESEANAEAKRINEDISNRHVFVVDKMPEGATYL